MLRNGRCYPLETSALRIVGSDCGSLPRWPTPDAGALERTNRSDSPGAAIRPTLGLAVKWPTATVGGSKNAANATSGRKPGSKHHAGTTLVDAIRTWPTPIVRDKRTAKGAERSPNAQGGEPLAVMVARNAGAAPASPGAAIQPTLPKLWPTPAGIGGDDGYSSELGQAAKAGKPGRARKDWATPRSEDSQCAGMRVSRGVADTLTAQTKDSDGQLNPDWVEWLMGYPIGFTVCAASETR